MNANHAFEPFIEKLSARVILSEHDRAAVLALPYHLREVAPSRYIVREGEKSGSCLIIAAGIAFRSKLTSRGTRQIVTLELPGDAVDLQQLVGDLTDENVQALSHTTLADVPRQAMRELIDDFPTLRRALAVTNMIETSVLREWVLNIGRREGRTRLAHLICELAVRFRQCVPEDGYILNLPMTQEQIGDALGMTAVHINRLLAMLEADGLLVRHGRSMIIPSWWRMTSVADFSAEYLHLGQQSAK